MAPKPGLSANLKGSFLMIAAMAGFAIEDALIKGAVHHLALGQLMVIFGVIGVGYFGLMALSQGEAVFHPAGLSRPMAVRAGFEVTGRLFYALAITLTPLVTASAILQATPLIVVGGAALIFGEKVGLLRWGAVLAGFCGVLVILRPGLAGFDARSVLALLGMAGFAGRDLATRAAPKVLSNNQLGVYGFIMLAIAGVVVWVSMGGADWPDGTGLLMVLATAAAGIAGYACLTGAMRTGDVGAVTPLRYTRLVFAMVIGALVFREHPDWATLAGSAIVVGAGLVALAPRPKAAP